MTMLSVRTPARLTARFTSWRDARQAAGLLPVAAPWLLAFSTLAAAPLLMPMAALAKERIAVVERPVGETTVDLGAKGDSVGDMLVFANSVFDAANKKQVGSDQGYCVRTVVGKSWECFWTLVLNDGKITVEGPFLDEGDSVMVVTGGTGKYEGAKGSMKLHARDATPTGYDFIYDLL